jgi:phosphoenolpyruvate carboxylase
MSDDAHLPQTTQLQAALSERLDGDRRQSASDPFTNPFLRFALDLSQRIERQDIALGELEHLVQDLTVAAFDGRVARLAAYMGPCDPAQIHADLEQMFERLADLGDFAAYARAVGAAPFGLVLTGHPTFALRRDLSTILVELATGWDAEGRRLSAADRAARRAVVADTVHEPPQALTLEMEHLWSVDALTSATDALETIHRVALSVGRRRWPDLWTQLTPKLMTLATWVGFDQDGRTDVTWQISFQKRLELKRLALQRRSASVATLSTGGAGAWESAIADIADQLEIAEKTVSDQLLALAAVAQDPTALPAFAKAMVDGRNAALVNGHGLEEAIARALTLAPDDMTQEALLLLRAGLAAQGVSLARIHVRLNAGQLHNAVRRQVRLRTAPTDPANRRSYFAAIERLITEAEPTRINFGDLVEEPASARRLMMTIAQMAKFVDASTQVRFLIAETEAGFTLLTALYFARLFGVEEIVEISPLFETEEAFERGEKVIEEALRSPQFRAHLQSHRRLAIEFGFSDSGRFIGQMAATFRIERLRLRLALLLEEQGLSDLEVVFFNTHGESIGRGGHPLSLADRFRYAAPPRSRAEFEARGIRIKEEDAFQGGEGYLPILTPNAALATLATALSTVLAPDPEAHNDLIYDDPNFAAEFFATIQQEFSSLVADPDYAALVGLFGTHLLQKAGSRPTQRQSGDGAGPRRLQSVSELRAIPNNGVLQQLGYLANSLFGVGAAAEKDVESYKTMHQGSARFRRALDMAEAAYQASDLQVVRAYAATLEPALWLDRATVDRRIIWDRFARNVAERANLGDALARVLRRLQSEDLSLHQIMTQKESDRRRRLLLLHGVRIALIQRIATLAVQFPDFNPRGDITRAVLQERLMRLDVTGALEFLVGVFPKGGGETPEADYGEPTDYAPAKAPAYAREHERVFEPLAKLFALCLRISAAINHEIGACG